MAMKKRDESKLYRPVGRACSGYVDVVTDIAKVDGVYVPAMARITIENGAVKEVARKAKKR